MQPQYVIVKKQSPYTFSRFQPSFDAAQTEAEKLCRKERVPFLVLAVVAEVRPVEVPVSWDKVAGLGLDEDSD